MDESTPLLGETASCKDVLQKKSVSSTETARPKSAPPINQHAHLDDSDEDLFIRQGSTRSKTSLGHSAELDEEWIAQTLNRQRSGGNEDEEFLNRDTNKNSQEGKSKIVNIVMVNIILIIWTIAGHMHNPVFSQYIYRRILEEVLGNSSLSSNNQSQLNSTVCYKPSPNETSDDVGYSLQEKAQQLTTETNMKFSLASYPFCFISTVLFGAYSDYFGRRMLFLIPLFGHLVDYILGTLIIYWEMDIRYFFVTGVITGICTSEIITIAWHTYIADNTPPKGSRTIGILVISVTESLTNAVLATGVGYYIQLKGFFLPSLTSAAILVLAIVAVICILPVKKKIPVNASLRERQEKEKSRLNPLKAIKNVFSFYFFEGSCRTRGMFLLYVTAYFVHTIAGRMGNIGTLWEMNYPLCWTPEMMGYYSTGSSIFSELIKLPLLKLLQCCCNEEVIAIYSNIIYSGALVLKSFSVNNLLMYGVSALSAFSVSCGAIILSILSRMAGPDRQGALFASFAIINIVCSILGTPAYSELYRYTVNLFRGTSFLVSAGVQCICTVFLIVFAVLSKMGYRSETEVIPMEDNERSPKPSADPKTEDTNV